VSSYYLSIFGVLLMLSKASINNTLLQGPEQGHSFKINVTDLTSNKSKYSKLTERATRTVSLIILRKWWSHTLETLAAIRTLSVRNAYCNGLSTTG